MRLVFMGTPGFAVPTLEGLLNSGHDLVAVYTQPDRPVGRGRQLAPLPVKKVALEHGLMVLQPDSLRERSEVERLAGLQPGVVVVAAFGQLLPRELLSIPPFGCLNVHPSLLPKFRGASPIATAILEGEETGATIMLMDEGMDTGPVLAQRSVSIEPEDTTESLAAKLARIGAELLLQTLPRWLAGELTPLPQDKERATYTRTITKEDGELDWHLSAVELWRRVRAFYPWPGCYTRWQGKLLKILEAVPLPQEAKREIGMVAEVGRLERERGVEARRIEEGEVVVLKPGEVPSNVAFGIQTGEGILGIVRVQLEGKRAMSSAEFLRGQKNFEGALLTGHKG